MCIVVHEGTAGTNHVPSIDAIGAPHVKEKTTLNYKKIVPAFALAALISAGGFATHIALADAVKPADHAVTATKTAAIPSKAIPQMPHPGYDTMPKSG